MGFSFDRTASFLFAVNNTVDSVASAAKSVICLGYNVLGTIKNPKALLGSLANIGANIAAGIAGSVTALINAKVGQLLNSALSPIRALQQKVAEFTQLAELAQATVANIANQAKDLEALLKDKQQCAAQTAQLMSCISNSIEDSLTGPILNKVNENINKIQNKVISDVIKPSGLLAQHIERNNMFLKKAQAQINFLT